MKEPNRHNFTQAFLDKLPNAEKGTRYMIYDTEIPKLAIRVTDTGSKSFVVLKLFNYKTLKVTLGKYPEMTIFNARKKAMEELNKIAEGINPNDEKNKLRSEMTLRELYNDFMERYSKKKKKSWKHDEREIPRFLSCWFNRKLSSITKQQVQILHEKIRDENGLYQANHLLERLSSMYNRAIEWGWDGKNPCVGIKKFKTKARDRYLLHDEVPRFFQALKEDENEIVRNYILLSLMTGARKSNVLAMRWEEIDFGRKIWRIPETKNGFPLEVPLIEQAYQLLLKIQETSTSVWVFPSPVLENQHLQDPKKAWKRILKRAGIENLRLHDIRRTLGSYQALMGTSLHIIGKTLGHRSLGTTQIYARLADKPIRDSMQNAVNEIYKISEENEE